MNAEPNKLPERFVHGFHAEDWAACWNMHLRGTLFGADFANEIEFGQPGVRGLSLGDLRAGNVGEGPLSRRMMHLRAAEVIRSGGTIGWGVSPYPFVEASAGTREDIVQLADLELRLERARRGLNPQAPSRIGCLFLAEATAAGRNMVSKLKGDDAFVMEVQIVAGLRLCRLDSRWLGDEPGDNEIAGYWSGKPLHADSPGWEFLLDGLIECTDEEELRLLREWAPEASVRTSGTQGPIGNPRMAPPPPSRYSMSAIGSP